MSVNGPYVIWGGALKASAPEKAKTLGPGEASSDSTEPQETCMSVTKWLEESPLPLTLTPPEEKEIPLSIDTTLVPRCAPNSNLVADSNTKDVTKSTTTSPKANGAEDDGVDVAAGASDSEGILGETPARPVLEQQRRTLEKTTRQPSPVQPKWMGRKTITRWKLRFKLKTDRE